MPTPAAAASAAEKRAGANAGSGVGNNRRSYTSSATSQGTGGMLKRVCMYYFSAMCSRCRLWTFFLEKPMVRWRGAGATIQT